MDSIDRLLLSITKGSIPKAEILLGGLAQGWSAKNTVTLKPETDCALALMLPKLPSAGKGSLLRLASALGSKGMQKYAGEVVKSLLTTLANEAASVPDRIAAARQVVDLQPTDDKALEQILDTISPRTGPTLTAGLLDAAAISKAPGAGAAILKRLEAWTPQAPNGGDPHSPPPAVFHPGCSWMRWTKAPSRRPISRWIRRGAGRSSQQGDRRAGEESCWRGAATCPTPTARR